MTDTKLLAIKHGRILVPLIALKYLLTIAAPAIDNIAVAMAYELGCLILVVALAVYAIHSVLRLTGVCDDRLALLSPTSRITLAAKNMAILAGYLIVSYLASYIPTFRESKPDMAHYLLPIPNYCISVFTGLSLMLFISYLLKSVRKRFALVVSAWISYAAVTAAGLAGIVLSLSGMHDQPHWLVGAAPGAKGFNFYSGIIPTCIVGVTPSVKVILAVMGANLAAGIIFFAGAYMLQRRRNNYLPVK